MLRKIMRTSDHLSLMMLTFFVIDQVNRQWVLWIVIFPRPFFLYCLAVAQRRLMMRQPPLNRHIAGGFAKACAPVPNRQNRPPINSTPPG
jgi:hypothetical protein